MDTLKGLEVLVLAVVAVYSVLAISVVISEWMYRRELARVSPETKRRLFKRGRVWDGAAVRFLLSGEFRKLDDPRFVRRCARHRTLVFVWMVAFALALATIAFALYRMGSLEY